MNRVMCTRALAAAAVGLCILLLPQPAPAGWLESVDRALNEAAAVVDEKVRQLGDEIVPPEEGALPGGVRSLLEQMHQEMDKAQRALDQTAGTGQERTKQARRCLNKAKKYLAKIDQQYGGQFPLDHPKLLEAEDRLLKLDERVNGNTRAAKRPSTAAKPKKEVKTASARSTTSPNKTPVDKANKKAEPKNVPAAEPKPQAQTVSAPSAANTQQAPVDKDNQKTGPKNVPVDKPEPKANATAATRKQEGQAAPSPTTAKPQQPQAAQATQEDKPENVAEDNPEQRADAAAAQSTEEANSRKESKGGRDRQENLKAELELAEKWILKLKPYQIKKSFEPYPTKNPAILKKRDANYAEFKPIWDEYQKVEFTGPKPRRLTELEDYLGRVTERYQESVSERRAAAAKRAAEDRKYAKSNRIVFSNQPIDPANPSNLTTEFKAGEYIYGLIQLGKTWGDIFGNRNIADVYMHLYVDDKKMDIQELTLRSQTVMGKKYALFEIAPELARMKSYSNPNVEYGTARIQAGYRTKGIRHGPAYFTWALSHLQPNSKHTFKFYVPLGAARPVESSFNIQGGDYSFYQELHQKIIRKLREHIVLPPAKMTDQKWEEVFRKLLARQGCKEVYRLNIISQDWLTEWKSLGGKKLEVRYLKAAVMTRHPNGHYFYRIYKLRQSRPENGEWGSPSITGYEFGAWVPDENIDK